MGMGKAPENPEISYPEHDMHKMLSFLASKPEYMKEAKQFLQSVQIPGDAQSIVHAKQAGKKASDIEYKAQDKDLSSQFRGYQTMEAKEHPDVKKAEKAKGMSDKKYTEDYEQDKSYIVFPYTITPEYEAKASVQRVKGEYKKEHEETKDKNRFDVTSTPVYEHQKSVEKATGDLNYKQDFEKNKGKMLGTDVTPEMARAHEMEPIRNKQKYQE